MFNFKQFARQAMLALALACASGATFAGPAYLVTIDTAMYSGESGLLDFGFLADLAAVPERVTLSHFTGALGAEYDRAGGVLGNLPGTVEFSGTGSANYLTQAVVLGGNFTFQLSFSGDFALPSNSNDAVGLTFAVTLFDAAFTDVLASLVQFDLLPFYAGNPASVVISANPDLVTVTDVAAAIPEPSQLLLILSALALAGVALRRRSR